MDSVGGKQQQPPPPPSFPLIILMSSSLEPKMENVDIAGIDSDQLPGPSPTPMPMPTIPPPPPPRPLESLYEISPVPPFLSKTYDLVDDLNLDPIISWGPAGQSFIVWDLPEFSRTVLPRHFKHNNFSSFVRQLNTYGFRKISTDRWEFANEDFLRGKKSSLKKINRRRSCQQIGSQVVSSSAETGQHGDGTESEIGKLKREKDFLMGEVVQLRQEHVITVQQINALHRRMQAAELRQKQMVSFLAKVLQNPVFLDHLKKLKEQRENAPTRVRRKFLKQQQQQPRQSESDNSLDEQIVKCRLDCQTEETSSIPLLPGIEHGESSAFSLAGYEYDENKRLSDHPLHGLVDDELVGFDIGEQDLFGGSAPTEDPQGKNGGMSSETDVGFINTGYFISLPGADTPEAMVSSDTVPPSGESIARSDSEISALRGKNIMNFETASAAADSGIGHLTAIPDDISQEGMFQDAIAPSSDFVNEGQFWNVGVEAGSLASGHEIWDNIDLVDAQEVEVADGSCSLWDLGLHTLEEVLDINKYVSGESSFQEHKDVDGHPSEDSPRKLEP